MSNQPTEPGIKDAATQPENKKVKAVKRAELHAAEQSVCKFLMVCGPHQAEAIRTTVAFAYGDKSLREFSAEEASLINPFLNYGAEKDKIKSPQNMRNYREDRVDTLMDLAEKYFSKDEVRRVIKALNRVANDDAEAKRAFDNFSRLPLNS